MDLRAAFESMDVARVEQFIKDKQEENIELDFKTVNSADLSDADDRKNLAKVISAFANSSGGLIVWGIDADRSEHD